MATGTLTLDAGSTFEYELDKDALPTVAGDLTAVTGNLVLDTGNLSILNLVELGSGSWSIDPSDKLTLISYTGSWNGGLFRLGSGGPTILDDTMINFNGTDWLFDYNDDTAGTNYSGDTTGAVSFVTMTAVPEPSISLLGGLGVLLLLRRRRD